MAADPCFLEYPEFPLPPIDPWLFGFATDISNRTHLRQCPCFSTGEYHLWLNWPQPEEREWYPPMDQFFVTSGAPEDIDATVHFSAESLQDLVRHLLVTPYTDRRLILETPCTVEMARAFFQVTANAGFLLPLSQTDVLGAIDRRALGPAAPSAEQYLLKIQSQLGSQAVRLLSEAILSAARR